MNEHGQGTGPRSWKVGVKRRGHADWVCNGMRFASEEEARKYAADPYWALTSVRERAVLPSDDEPNR